MNLRNMLPGRTMFEKTRQEKSSDGGFLSLVFRGAGGEAGMSYATTQLRPVVLPTFDPPMMKTRGAEKCDGNASFSANAAM